MSDKQVIVLIHGHGVDASIWNAVYDDLTADYSVVKPDLSEQTSHETIQAYAEALFSLLQTSHIESCVLVGHSMGGYIALAFAEQHPELLSGLILVNSTAFADDEAKKKARQKAIETLKETGSRPFIEQTVPKMFAEAFGESHSGEVRRYVEQFSELPPEALIAGLKAMASRQGRVHILQNAVFPALIIAGQQDQLIPIEKSKELVGAAPNVQTVVLENAGHLGMIESPDEVKKAIRDFVSNL